MAGKNRQALGHTSCLGFQTLPVALIKDITSTFRLYPDLFIKIFLLMSREHKIKKCYAEVLYYMNSKALLQLSRLHWHCDNSSLLWNETLKTDKRYCNGCSLLKNLTHTKSLMNFNEIVLMLLRCKNQPTCMGKRHGTWSLNTNSLLQIERNIRRADSLHTLVSHWNKHLRGAGSQPGKILNSEIRCIFL